MVESLVLGLRAEGKGAGTARILSTMGARHRAFERATSPPPRDETELLARALALRGCAVDDLAERWGVQLGGARRSSKGKVGELLERALGATGGSRATWDFPGLRIELKTIPVNEQGMPCESTFVCSVSLLDADRADWGSSWVRAKLGRVLWMPVVTNKAGSRYLATARLWSPTPEEEQVLAGDFEEIVGHIGLGGVEGVSGHVGRWLQLRPKAAHARIRTLAPGADDETIATVPRGFYLRARFTASILLT